MNTLKEVSELIPAFPAPIPRLVKTADMPLIKNPQIKQLPLNEFEKMTATSRNAPFKWTETLMASKDFKESIDNQRAKMTDAEKNAEAASLDPRIKRYFEKSLENLVICDLQHPLLGKGVFTTTEISVDTIVSIYCGELCAEDNAALKYSAYNLTINSVLKNKYKVINANDYGNISSFFTCLPAAYELQEFGETLPKNIATANLARMEITYLGYQLVCLVTTRTIKQYEQLGFSYYFQAYFFRDRKRFIGPALFDPYGETIEWFVSLMFHYKNNNYYLQLPNSIKQQPFDDKLFTHLPLYYFMQIVAQAQLSDPNGNLLLPAPVVVGGVTYNAKVPIPFSIVWPRLLEYAAIIERKQPVQIALTKTVTSSNEVICLPVLEIYSDKPFYAEIKLTDHGKA